MIRPDLLLKELKTINVAASEYAEGFKEYDIAKFSFKNGIEYALEWISINYKRPEPHKLVLLKNFNGYVYTGYGSKNNPENKYKFFIDKAPEGKDEVTDEIIEWRPIEMI